jgi:hypothetical protein
MKYLETLRQASLIGALSSATVLITAAATPAAPLEGWAYDASSNQLTFALPDGVKPRYFLMAQPARIVVDIPDTQIGTVPTEQEFSGSIKRITVSQVQPQLTRVILEMSKDAVFARGQVKLENVGDAEPGQDRWVVRPLLVTDKQAGEPKPAPQPIAAPPVVPASAAPATPAAPMPAPAVTPNRPKPISAKPPTPAEMPPGMEGVAAKPIAAPEAVSPISKPITRPPEAVQAAVLPPAPAPEPIREIVARPEVPPAPPSLGNSPVPIARLPEMPSVPPAPPLPSNPNSPAALVTPMPVARPDLLPPAPNGSLPNLTPGSSPLVSVPPLASITTPNSPIAVPSPVSSGLPPLPPSPNADTPRIGAVIAPSPASPSPIASNEPPLPPTSPRDALGGTPQGEIIVPTAPSPIAFSNPVPATSFGTPSQLPAVVRPATGVVNFGQQLPTQATLPVGASPLPSAPVGTGVVALDNLTTGGIAVPAGTALKLRYEQPSPLKLKAGERQQSLFVLQTPIVDAMGRVIAPQGSTILGEFATDKEGSRLFTRVLSTNIRSLPFNAQSDMFLAQRKVNDRNLIQNSGIGAVAGAIIGGLGGSMLGGAAAGAAVTYAIAPKEVVLQPGQIFEVRLTQDFLASR